MNTIKMLPREDFENHVKLRGIKIPCYKKKELEDMYPDDDWLLVGETKAKNKKKIRSKLYLSDVIDIDELDVDDDGNEIPFSVSRVGTYSKLFYRRAGYVPVDSGEEATYVALLKFRFAFFLLFWGLILGILVGIGILISMLLQGWGKEPVDTGDNGPVILNPMPPVDSNQVKDDDDKETGRPLDEGAYMSMEYQLKAKLSLSTGKIGIHFRNPGRSNQNVSIELYVVSGDTEVKIAESGVIEPGNLLSELTFIDGSAVLSEGKYEGKFMVIYYNPETGERAVVESEIVNVKITVEA